MAKVGGCVAGILADFDDFSSGMVHGMQVGFWLLASFEFDGSDWSLKWQ